MCASYSEMILLSAYAVMYINGSFSLVWPNIQITYMKYTCLVYLCGPREVPAAPERRVATCSGVTCETLQPNVTKECHQPAPAQPGQARAAARNFIELIIDTWRT